MSLNIVLLILQHLHPHTNPHLRIIPTKLPTALALHAPRRDIRPRPDLVAVPRQPHRILVHVDIAPRRARRIRRAAAALARAAVPADEEGAAARHARADDGDVHLEGREEPGLVPEPRHVVRVQVHDRDVVDADARRDDDEKAGREEREHLQLLRRADLQRHQGPQRDDEDYHVEEDVDRPGGDDVDAFVDAGALGARDEDLPVVPERPGWH